jgi:hypothetical protein
VEPVKTAEIVTAPLCVTMHDAPLGDGQALHELNVNPAAGVAVSVSVEPLLPVAEHVDEQLNGCPPPRVPVIAPLLAGVTETFREYCRVKLAATVSGAIIVTVAEALDALATVLPVQLLNV